MRLVTRLDTAGYIVDQPGNMRTGKLGVVHGHWSSLVIKHGGCGSQSCMGDNAAQTLGLDIPRGCRCHVVDQLCKLVWLHLLQLQLLQLLQLLRLV